MKKTLLVTLIALLVTTVGFSEENQIPLIGETAPKFSAQSTNGKITFPNDFGKSWKILFSHPGDFTPVCTSDILELAYMQEKFEELGVKIAVMSTDNVDKHNLWKAHLEELNYKDRGTFKIHFPIIDDHMGTVSRKYGMLHDQVSTSKDVRGVFILDGENTVRSINFYPMEIGRNMDEVVRIIKALQTVETANVKTPANWNEGDDVIVPFNPGENASPDEYYSIGNQLWFKKMK